ncbi:MAG: arginine deiminase family protein [Cyanobacteria bacterium P01_A01_bin.83]
MVFRNSETASLRSVVVSSGDHFPSTLLPEHIINQTMEQTHAAGEMLLPNVAKRQLQDLTKLLSQLGVEVITPPNQKISCSQIYTRDPFIAINDKIILSRMKEEVRRDEVAIFASLFSDSAKLCYLPEDCFLEGGDVLLDEDFVYVGVGNRTNWEAVRWLIQEFPHKKIVPLKLNDGILHLDCCLNLFGEDGVVIFRAGIDDQEVLPRLSPVRRNYIFVSKREQTRLGTNFLCVSTETIILGDDTPYLYQSLRQQGQNVITMNFSQPLLLGGKLRCCSNDIERF